MNSMLSSVADGHLPNGLLIQLLDDELSPLEAAKAENHLASCCACNSRYAELRRTSSSFDEFIDALRPSYYLSERQELASKLDGIDEKKLTRMDVKPTHRLQWFGLAAAAALTIGVLYLPSSLRVKPEMKATVQLANDATNAFEIDGETFISLPFSNPELPVNARRIVQMQVPISSLAEAGIVVEPIANRMAQPDHSVLADVLLGLDGQPLAVHVVSSD